MVGNKERITLNIPLSDFIGDKSNVSYISNRIMVQFHSLKSNVKIQYFGRWELVIYLPVLPVQIMIDVKFLWEVRSLSWKHEIWQQQVVFISAQSKFPLNSPPPPKNYYAMNRNLFRDSRSLNDFHRSLQNDTKCTINTLAQKRYS